jgi:hypothetical protein
MPHTPSGTTQTGVDIAALNQQIYAESAFVDRILTNCEQVIVGQKHMVSRLLLGLLSNGHVLLEGLPGLAKTLAIKTLSASVHGDFQRIQAVLHSAAGHPALNLILETCVKHQVTLEQLLDEAHAYELG